MRVFLVRQFFVSARLNDLTIVDDEDLLAVANSAQPVGDHDRSSTFHCPIEGLLHYLLTLLVESRRSLVENQNLGVFDDSSSNGNPLFLPTGKFGALQTTIFIEAFTELDLALAVSEFVNRVSMHLLDPVEVQLEILVLIFGNQVGKRRLSRVRVDPLLDKLPAHCKLASLGSLGNLHFLLIGAHLGVQDRSLFALPLKVENKVVPLDANNLTFVLQLSDKEVRILTDLVKRDFVRFLEHLEQKELFFVR